MANSLSLIAEGATPFEIELLLAGRRDAVAPGSEAQILSELGVGAGAAVAGSAGASVVPSGIKLVGSTAKGLSPTAAIGVAVSAVGVVAAGVVALWVGVGSFAPEAQPAPKPQPPAQAVEHTVALPEPVEQAHVEPVGVEPVQPVAPPKSAPPVRVSRDPLAAELAAIDEARRALSGGDPALALRMLDDHARRFRRPRLAAEATVLRIEALVKKGDTSAATRLGNRFLARQPNGPYERRVRSLIRHAEGP